jgi:aryl-alcohol dehydrogenase-like predicted oxidoreductase
MRYRSFARSGAAVSAISLVLGDHPGRNEDRVKLIYAALEAGINTFELQSREPAVAASLGEALSAVDRSMVFVALRVGWAKDRNGRRVRDLSADGLTGAIETTLARTRLGRLDVVVLDVRDDERLPDHVISALQSTQAAQRVRMLGVGGGDGVDPYIGSGVFDVLATTYNLQSGWRERNRLKHASQADMATVVAIDLRTSLAFGRAALKGVSILSPPPSFAGPSAGGGRVVVIDSSSEEGSGDENDAGGGKGEVIVLDDEGAVWSPPPAAGAAGGAPPASPPHNSTQQW